MKNRVYISFKGELVDLLSRNDRKKGNYLEVEFPGKRSIKDLIQSLRIPHTEVGAIRMNGEWVNASAVLNGDEHLDVFPVEPAPEPTEAPSFICDVHLWKLARRLRFLGFDTRFDPRWDDAELAEISFHENRIMLTRDRGLLMRNAVHQGALIRNADPEKQVIEVIRRFGIRHFIQPFSRCIVCGVILEAVNPTDANFKKKLIHQVPDGILNRYHEFHHCASCEKIYWKGSHHEKLKRLLHSYALDWENNPVT
ncbi:MAG: Mut7-C RNAse domain-containing protein [Candidatus Omnitrophota bacterium]